MSYYILSRFIKQTDTVLLSRNQPPPETFWSLESWNVHDPELSVITTELGWANNMPLIMVLSNLEHRMSVRMVGQDGEDRFILNKPT